MQNNSVRTSLQSKISERSFLEPIEEHLNESDIFPQIEIDENHQPPIITPKN
jgi:hypothetical protein